MLIHGRDDPDAEMSRWGVYGNPIEGVVALDVNYQSIVLHFLDRIAATKAQMTMGWPYFDDDAP
jgi:hypothetical protein